MMDEDNSDLSPEERFRDIPRILRALRQAARDAMAQHKRMGLPAATWRNGQVEWIQPEDLEATPSAQDDG